MADNRDKSFAPPPGMNDESKASQQQTGYSSSYPGHGYQHTGYEPQPAYPPPSGYPGAVPQPGFQPYGHVPTSIYAPAAEDEPTVKGFNFSDESVRRGFIRKVYCILSAQLLCTLGAVLLFVYSNDTKKFAAHNFGVFYIALAIVLVTIIMLSCCEGVRREAPCNFIVLGLFTIGESYMVAMCTLRFEENTVLLAVFVTAVVCVALTIFALQTKYDFTVMGGTLFVALLLFLIVSLIGAFFPGDIFRLIMAWAGAVLFSIYLIYDTQLLTGGSHKRYSLSPEEYVFGALAIYLDIINLFIYILQILGSSKD